MVVIVKEEQLPFRSASGSLLAKSFLTFQVKRLMIHFF